MHALAMVVLASGGRVEVPVRVMEDFSPGGEIVTWTDPLTRARVVTVRQYWLRSDCGQQRAPSHRI